MVELFKEYEPIQAIYENETEYICIPQTPEGGEPITIFYDKKLKKYDELYWYEYSPIEDIEASNLIYGKEIDFGD